MSISTDLEKLVSLRDRGNLSPSEFEKAKERLLSEEVPDVSPIIDGNQSAVPEESEGAKPGRSRLIAVLSTVPVVFLAGSSAIDPSLLKLLALTGFTVAATLNWMVFFVERHRDRSSDVPDGG